MEASGAKCLFLVTSANGVVGTGDIEDILDAGVEEGRLVGREVFRAATWYCQDPFSRERFKEYEEEYANDGGGLAKVATSEEEPTSASTWLKARFMVELD